MSVAAPLPADRRARLVDFAARMRSRQLRLAAAAAAMRAALAGALPALALAWFWPRYGWWVGGAVALLAIVSAGRAALRARRLSDALLLRVDDGAEAAGLNQVGDGLATWLENDRRPVARPMTDWLADDLDRDIRALPVAAIRQVGRRRLGRLRWIVVILILLLLAWLLSLWWQPSWSGALGGRPQVPNGGTPPLSAAGAVPADGEVEVMPTPRPAEAEPSRDGSPAPGDAPDPPEQPTVPPPPSLPPAPLLQLPPQQVFVVPEFIADGPTRRMRAHVAEVAGGESPTATRRAGGSGAGDAQTPPPPPDRTAFERAAERAQAARHVPEPERAIVRRFFRLLREAAK